MTFYDFGHTVNEQQTTQGAEWCMPFWHASGRCCPGLECPSPSAAAHLIKHRGHMTLLYFLTASEQPNNGHAVYRGSELRGAWYRLRTGTLKGASCSKTPRRLHGYISLAVETTPAHSRIACGDGQKSRQRHWQAAWIYSAPQRDHLHSRSYIM